MEAIFTIPMMFLACLTFEVPEGKEAVISGYAFQQPVTIRAHAFSRVDLVDNQYNVPAFGSCPAVDAETGSLLYIWGGRFTVGSNAGMLKTHN